MRSAGKPSAIWPIKNAEGQTQVLHVRFDHPDGKEYRWRLPGASGWGLNARKVSTLPLYGSERVKEWSKDADVVVVVAGEKAADALLKAGLCALGTVTGAGGTPELKALRVLEGFEVVLWPDNDQQGRAHMERVAATLRGVAAEVRVFEWHAAPEKGDAADHPAVRSRDPEGVDRLLQDLMEAPRWVSQVSPSPNKGVTPVIPLRFAEMAPPGPREYVVEGLIPKGHATTLFGDGGSAKSVLALSAGIALAAGAEEWLGRKVQNCPVLYADFELDADEQRRRAYQVARGRLLEKPPHDLLYVCGLGRPVGEVLAGCLNICDAEDVGLVIVDSSVSRCRATPRAPVTSSSSTTITSTLHSEQQASRCWS